MPLPDPGAGQSQYQFELYFNYPDFFHNGVYEVTMYYQYTVFTYNPYPMGTTYYGSETAQFEIDNLTIRNVRVEDAGGGPLSSGGGGAAASSGDDYIFWDPDTMLQPPAIKFDLTDTQHGTAWVQARIYDIGQTLIRTMPPIYCPRPTSQTEKIQWDGTDDNGNVMPAGIYLFHLEACGEDPQYIPVYGTDKLRSGQWRTDWLRIAGAQFSVPQGVQATPLLIGSIRIYYYLIDTRDAYDFYVEVKDEDNNRVLGPYRDVTKVKVNVWNQITFPVTSLQKGGKYTILLTAVDDDATDDKGHRKRVALQRGLLFFHVPVINIANTKGWINVTINFDAYKHVKEQWGRQKAIRGNWLEPQPTSSPAPSQQPTLIPATSLYQQNPESRCCMKDITAQEFLEQLKTKWRTRGSRQVPDNTDTNAIFFIWGHGPGDDKINTNSGSVLKGKIIFTRAPRAIIGGGGEGVALTNQDPTLNQAIAQYYPGYTIKYLSSLSKTNNIRDADSVRLVFLIGCNITLPQGQRDLIEDIVSRLGADAGISIGLSENSYDIARRLSEGIWKRLSGYDDTQGYTGNYMTISGAVNSTEAALKEFIETLGGDYSRKVKVVGSGVNRTLSPPFWGDVGK